MAPVRRVLSFVLVFPAAFLSAQCSNDHRTNKDAGIQITDFTITGTQTISATDLARMTTDFIGSCFDEDSEELEERVRASFQNRGYFKAEVKSLRVKPRDPLGIPKPVLLDGDIAEGPQYTLADVSFLKNTLSPPKNFAGSFPSRKVTWSSEIRSPAAWKACANSTALTVISITSPYPRPSSAQMPPSI
jgi:hypothetical protein